METYIRAAIIKDRKILVVQQMWHGWYLPGINKLDYESDLECLSRGVRSCLSGSKIKNISFYKEFNCGGGRSRVYSETRIYFAAFIGEEGMPSGKIRDKLWLKYDLLDLDSDKFPSITQKVIESLHKDGKI